MGLPNKKTCYMNINKDNIDLNAPAFGAGAQTLESLTAEPTSVEEPVITEDISEEETVDSVEENKVPYSRFKKFHDKALQAEQEAAEWRARVEELERRPTRTESTSTTEMPDYWVELYGDSEASERAWKIQERREQEIQERAYEAGLRGAQEYESTQKQQLDSNVEAIDESFEMLSDYLGRDLNAKEQSAILDIVDDYTPKNADGNYAGPLMPFDKAWEVYELKQNSGKTVQRKDRDSVASLTGVSSQGNTDNAEEVNKNFNPLARGSWRSRL